MKVAVTFDFWETLVRDTPAGLSGARGMRLARLADVLRRAGHPQPASVIEEAYERCGAEMSARFWTDNRDCTIAEQVTLFVRCVDDELRLPPALLDEAVAAYSEPVLYWPPALIPGAGDAVRALAYCGFRLGIVSNTGRTPGRILRAVLRAHGLLDCFAAASFSDEVGVRKPAPAIFTATLARLGVPAADAVHIGDNPQADIAGARAVGMRAAHYAAEGRSPSPDADLVVTDLSEFPGMVMRALRA